MCQVMFIFTAFLKFDFQLVVCTFSDFLLFAIFVYFICSLFYWGYSHPSKITIILEKEENDIIPYTAVSFKRNLVLPVF